MRSPRHAWVLILAFAVVVAATSASCQKKTTSNVVILEPSGELQLVVNNKRFTKDVKVVSSGKRMQGDLLEVYATVQNQTEETVPFEYRVEWYDQDEVELETPITSWKPVTLDGRMTKTLRELSPKANARGAKLYVRDPNPVLP